MNRQLNAALQKRNALPPAFYARLQPYMYYCFLRDVQAQAITTYRGVPSNASTVVAVNYVGDTTVHWSGFT